jgi:glycosyltransferase involved in cell wall biosynthesis
LVSVVITTYNRRQYVRAALESVLAQDYRDKEIIVIDDGSTDGSADELSGLPLQYVWKENGGISSARNLGISLSKGDLIAFLDVDDLWKKNKLSTQVRLMGEEASPVSYTDEVWMRNGKWLNQCHRHRKYSGMIYRHCLPLCIISPSSALVGREVFNEVGLFDESLPVCEDYDMWLRVACRYPIVFIDRPLIIKQGGHPDQLSRRFEAMDRFRIRSLVNMLSRGVLTPEQRICTLHVLRKKCAIYAKGAEKRERFGEAEKYRRIPDDLDDAALSLTD